MPTSDYIKTVWVDDDIPALDADNLNHIEDGIERVTEAVQALETAVPAKASDLDSDSGYCTPRQVQEVFVNYLLDGKIWIENGKLCFTDTAGTDWTVVRKGVVE